MGRKMKNYCGMVVLADGLGIKDKEICGGMPGQRPLARHDRAAEDAA
jgi:hypothetical protein